MDAPRKIEIDISIRFRDVDAMGHVNNSVFFTYFEEGRKAFIGRLLGIVEPSEYYFILARIECEYLKAVTLSNHIFLQVWIGKIGEKSFTFKYQVNDREEASLVYAKAESVQVFFDYEAGKTTKVPEGFIENVSSYIER